MNLYFLRHGKACSRSRKWTPDSTRPLTREGEKKMRVIARGIKAMDTGVELILTSPYIRAFRTAEILGEALESAKLVESNNLAAESLPEDLVEELAETYSGVKDLVLVGHEPFLTGLMSVLLTGKPGVPLELRKGGMAKLSVSRLRFGACATLSWMLTPRQAANLARK